MILYKSYTKFLLNIMRALTALLAIYGMAMLVTASKDLADVLVDIHDHWGRPDSAEWVDLLSTNDLLSNSSLVK